MAIFGLSDTQNKMNSIAAELYNNQRKQEFRRTIKNIVNVARELTTNELPKELLSKKTKLLAKNKYRQKHANMKNWK